MAKIKEVAQLANVSISTVSHVVNGTRYVSPKTKEQVQAAIATLGYKANSAARALKAGSFQTIAMLVERSTNPFFSEVVQAFEEVCFNEGFLLTISICDGQEERQVEQMKFLQARGADGYAILLESISGGLAKLLRNENQTPTIALDSGEYEDIPSFKDNSFLGGQIAARHFAELGRRRILVLAGPERHSRMMDRLSGFQQEWSMNGFDVDDVRIVHSPLTFSAGFKATMDAGTKLAKVDGVMALCDALAIGSMAAISQLGRQVPEEIAVIGYDNIEMSKYTSPTLTTVSQSASRFGRAAAEAIISNIKGENTETSDQLVQPRLLKRGSTAT
ncbi:MAG: LacI family DNA-binding transcriptional regulator [Ascidiaceihabitans sp.]|uniref:LacI family DNA-binding transcriptional regulator n=1 Tax=Rhodobacterales TaxID=204455 RepID=UPI003299B24A